MGARHDRFHGVDRRVNAAADGERGLHLRRGDCEPAEAEGQLARVGEVERQLVRLLHVDVGLVETVEEDRDHQPRLVQPVGHAGGGEERGELHRDGDPHAALDRGEALERPVLHGDASLLRVRRHEVDVQLERVGTGLLEEARIPGPASRGVSVERRDGREHGPRP